MAACVTGSSVHCSTDNSKMDSVLQQDRSTDSSKTQLLRTKELEKFNSHYSRRPFESLGNINTSDRVSEKKRSSTEPMHRSFSFTSTTVLHRNHATSSANGFHAPLAKRFAFDDNSSPKRLSENMASLIQSSSTPSMKTSERTSLMHKSDKIYPCNSSSFQRNLPVSSRDSQLQEFSKCNLRPGDSIESNKRLDPSNKVSTPYISTSNLSNFQSEKELSVFNSPSFRSFNNSKAREIKTASPVWQQRGVLRCSLATKNETGNSPLPISNTSSSFRNQTERHSGNTFHGNLDGAKASKTPLMSRQKGYVGSNTPQGHQASTPIVNRSHSRNPSVSKTPTPRKFPGPAGLLPKLVCKIYMLQIISIYWTRLNKTLYVVFFFPSYSSAKKPLGNLQYYQNLIVLFV